MLYGPDSQEAADQVLCRGIKQISIQRAMFLHHKLMFDLRYLRAERAYSYTPRLDGTAVALELAFRLMLC